jgi:hypothetical protein
LEPLAKWKNAHVKPLNISEFKLQKRCKHTSYIKALTLPVEQEEVLVMRNCHHNDIAALHNRYLKETPKLTISSRIIAQYCDEFISLVRPYFTGKSSIHNFISGKKGKLRTRYLEALHKIKSDGFDLKKDSGIKMFIKNERYNEVKPPRAIMGRDPKFNIMYSMYTTPLEEAMQHLPQIMKGENFLGRGKKFAAIMSKIYAEIDYSKFEGSQRAKLLELVEWYILKRLYPEDDLIRQLFKAKLAKDGTTCNGVKFSFFGTRGSGDMDTGLFNTILNWIACRRFEDYNNTGGKGRFIVDGDDGVIGINNENATFIDTAKSFGFDAKIFKRMDYHDVEFCSSKFIEISHGTYYQVQNVNKLLNNLQYVINTEFYESLPTYFGSLGFMYEKLYKDIPVYYEMAKFLTTCANSYINTNMIEKFSYLASEAFKAKESDFKVDIPLCKAELSLCFKLDHVKINSLTSWFNNHSLRFPCEVSKPYKCRLRNRFADISLTDCNNMEFYTNKLCDKKHRLLVKMSLL